MMLPPEQLRVAADAMDVKAGKLFDAGREDEAGALWDRAIEYRILANQQEAEGK